MTSPISPAQFQHIDDVSQIPAETRRLASTTARKQAAQRSATSWAVRVDHSDHDSLKEGVTSRQQTHMLLSKEEYPTAEEAEIGAYSWGISRGTYPTRVRHV